MDLNGVFSERKGAYLNELNLFVAHFKTIPSMISETNIDCIKANTWFAENYKGEIKKHYFLKRYYKKRNYIAMWFRF